jgi:hypothetical protein
MGESGIGMDEGECAEASVGNGVREYILDMICGLATMAADANQMDIYQALRSVEAVAAVSCSRQDCVG